MIEPFEQFMVVRYLLQLLTHGQLPPKAMAEVCDFLEGNCSFLGLELWDENFSEGLDKYQDAVREKTGVRTAYRNILATIKTKLNKRFAELEGTPPGSLETNLIVLAEELKLDSLEREFLGLLVRYRIHENFTCLFNDLTRKHLSLVAACASCLGAGRQSLTEKLRPSSRLLTTGVVYQQGRSGQDLDDQYDLPEAVYTGLLKACGAKEDIRHYILGPPATASLEWSDFEHLGEMRTRLAKFLKTAIDKRIRGVNILLWGPPGTGKTEFCKTLAQHLRVNLYAIGEKDEDGREPSRQERTGSLQLSQNLLRYQSNSLLLFDEMDDLFEGSPFARLWGIKPSAGSKVFIHRLFENNPIPTIWTINEPRFLDNAVIRRMSLAMEITTPPLKARERVWKQVLKKNDLFLPPEETHELAEMEIPPAIIDNAARVAKQIEGDMEDFRFAISGIVKAMSGRKPKDKVHDTTAFCPELIQADLNIEQLTRQLQKTCRRDFSLCLFGPPGTGKSAYVRHLAEALELPVLFKRASDLMDAFVGGTEENIAIAFQEAIDNEAFLVFDEADSLLGDRRHAVRNWEVSQVNEMLTWMERHPLPFACTTNLMDRLDQASLRRFTFKCHFDYLSQQQIALAFSEFFGLQVPAKNLPCLQGVTAGDFAVVRKKAGILGCENDLESLLGLLKKEVTEKNYRPAHSLGFAREPSIDCAKSGN